MSNTISYIKSSGGTVNGAVVDDSTNDLNTELSRAGAMGYFPENCLSLIHYHDPNANDTYVSYSSGEIRRASGYKTYVIPVVGGEKLYVSRVDPLSNIHVSFTWRYNDPSSMVIGTVVMGYIGGWINDSSNAPGDAGYEIDVPYGCRYAIVSSNILFDSGGHPNVCFSKQHNVYKIERVYYDEGEDLLGEGKLDARFTRNMLDVSEESNFVPYYYAEYNSGHFISNSDFITFAVRVTPGTKISFNNAFGNGHVSFYKQYVHSLVKLGIVQGSIIADYITGFSNDPKQGYTVPDGAHMMLVSIPWERANQYQVEEGSSSTSYVSHRSGIYQSDILDGSSVFTVGPGMAYSTISEAVAAATDDSEILVFPGVYNESVHAWGKRIRIRGTSKRDCIIRHSAMDYTNPPLEMSHGELSNLTIHGTRDGSAVDERRAYCLHVEDDSAAGSSLFVHDVVFVNDVHHAVGIGLRNDYTLEFNNCSFEATATNSALYCHDHDTISTGEDNQVLVLDGCTLRSNSAYTIALQSQEIEGNHATLKARRNVVVNDTNPTHLISMTKWNNRNQGSSGFMGSYAWELDRTSALNTLDTLNSVH